MPGEPVVDKRFDDAFWRTGLAEHAAQLNVGRIVIAGMLSEHCVGTTARSAVAHGFDVVLAADGHTTWDNDLLDGAAAVAYQNMLLGGFGTPDHEVAVVPAADIALLAAQGRAEALGQRADDLVAGGVGLLVGERPVGRLEHQVDGQALAALPHLRPS